MIPIGGSHRAPPSSGCLTGFAAFFGALLNMTFLFAGSASTNPVMFTLAVGLILAWRVAGTTASTATCSLGSGRPGRTEGTLKGEPEPGPASPASG